jgi:hypothetical protein
MSDHHDGVVEFQDEPNIGVSSVVIVLTFVFLVLIVWGGLIYYRSAQSDALNQRELDGKPTAELRQLRQSEAASLVSLRWIDKSKGRVQIPIALAMDLVRQRYQSR